MVNKTLRNTIGGLAVLAGVFGSSMADTNDVYRPVITKMEVENVTPSNKTVRIYATNFDTNKVKNCYVYRSTDLKSWTKDASRIADQSSITNVIKKNYDYKSNSPYFTNSFYRVKCDPRVD